MNEEVLAILRATFCPDCLPKLLEAMAEGQRVWEDDAFNGLKALEVAGIRPRIRMEAPAP